MNKIIPAVVLSAVLAFGLSPVAYASSDLLERIADLEEKIIQKDAIIQEQLKVIIQLSTTYEPFNEEKFSSTGGFNPEWLTNERNVIIDTCASAQTDGYTPSYCQYVQ